MSRTVARSSPPFKLEPRRPAPPADGFIARRDTDVRGLPHDPRPRDRLHLARPRVVSEAPRCYNRRRPLAARRLPPL